MSDVLLSVKDLKVNYGGIEAVKGISFDIEEGQIVSLIGANGAGKSSTLRAISGLVKPKSGSIQYKGEELAGAVREAAETRLCAGIGVFQAGIAVRSDL